MRAARMVLASETEADQHWTEARIKLLTGGEKIRARFMRQDSFEYMPHYKIWIAGNHKPELRSTDAAIRRRFHIIPFANTVSAETRDEDLHDKLKAEWPGILAWMIAGAQMWHAAGLAPPAAVVSATEEYFTDEDVVGANQGLLAPSGPLVRDVDNDARHSGAERIEN